MQIRDALNNEVITLSESIAIVGSSDTLLDNEYGDIIDSFEQVVRFNNALVCGYEKHVGSRTSIIVANPHVFEDRKGHHHQKIRKGSLAYHKNNTGEESVLVEANSFRGVLQNHVVSRGVPACPTARKIRTEHTVGFSFILHCVLNGIKPAMFGFSMDMTRRGSHYWESRDSVNKIGHSPGLELEALLELEGWERVEIYR